MTENLSQEQKIVQGLGTFLSHYIVPIQRENESLMKENERLVEEVTRLKQKVLEYESTLLDIGHSRCCSCENVYDADDVDWCSKCHRTMCEECAEESESTCDCGKWVCEECNALERCKECGEFVCEFCSRNKIHLCDALPPKKTD
jgi:hypothetical protein